MGIFFRVYKQIQGLVKMVSEEGLGFQFQGLRTSGLGMKSFGVFEFRLFGFGGSVFCWDSVRFFV